MKKVIDCDGVFEIMTQAPFPTGDPQDEEVEAHLLVCHECRCLAEALRPAVGLFHESLVDEPELPRYTGRCASGILASPAPGFGLQRYGALWIAGLAAAFLLWLNVSDPLGKHPFGSGISLGGATFGGVPLGDATYGDSTNGGAGGSGAFGDGEGSPNSAGLQMLHALELPGACRQLEKPHGLSTLRSEMSVKAAMASWRDGEFQCCTVCHRRSGSAPASMSAVRAMQSACSACHLPPPNWTAIDGSRLLLAVIRRLPG